MCFEVEIVLRLFFFKGIVRVIVEVGKGWVGFRIEEEDGLVGDRDYIY